jgi:hypothetical protein
MVALLPSNEAPGRATFTAENWRQLEAARKSLGVTIRSRRQEAQKDMGS